MKLHACIHCGSRLRTYTELQEHLKNHPNVCVTCYRVFSNRSKHLAHKCKVEEYLCEICQRYYSTQTQLARQKRDGVEADSSVYAIRPTTDLVPPTNIARHV